jgi:hypothetical protein
MVEALAGFVRLGAPTRFFNAWPYRANNSVALGWRSGVSLNYLKSYVNLLLGHYKSPLVRWMS